MAAAFILQAVRGPWGSFAVGAQLAPVASFADLLRAVRNLLRVPAAAPLALHYLDDEGDWCVLASDSDLRSVPATGAALPVRVTCSAVPGRLPLHAATRERAMSSSSGEWELLEEAGGAAAAATSGASPTGALPEDWKPPSGMEFARAIEFSVNGRVVRVEDPDPRTTLAQYLREELRLCGTKIGCGEGGCGACTVVLTSRDVASGGLVHRPVNACLRLLCSMDGMGVTTVEGVGSLRAGLHPVQSRLVKANGTQCGFCTPGWVMSMYGLLQQSPSAPTQAEVENHFDGNLCRCTGYRPILEAFRSFAADAPSGGCCTGSGGCGGGACGGGSAGGCGSKDTGCCAAASSAAVASVAAAAAAPAAAGGAMPGCTGTCATCPCASSCHAAGDAGAAGKGASLDDLEDIAGPLDRAKYPPPALPLPPAAAPLPLHLSRAGYHWFRPTTLDQLLRLLSSMPATPAKLVVGNTAAGVDKYYQDAPSDWRVLVDVSRVPEFSTFVVGERVATLGASVTLGQLVEQVAALPQPAPEPLAVLRRHLLHVANNQVRNAASWAGNLALARHHHLFPSDVMLLCITLGATLTVYDRRTDTVREDVPAEELLEWEPPAPTPSGTRDGPPASDFADPLVLLALHVPLPADPAAVRVHTFKVTQRHQNSHALVNAGFHFVVERGASGALGDVRCVSARIVAGGVGRRTFRATETERFLGGRQLDQATVTGALRMLMADVDRVGDYPVFGSPAYRRSTLQHCLFKFILTCQPDGAVPPRLLSTMLPYERPVSSGAQAFKDDPAVYPVSKALPKLSAPMQATGEARYVVDTPAAPGTLHGAFVGSAQPLATVVAVDASEALRAGGVVDVVTAADVPGANEVGAFPGDEPLFVPVGGVAQSVRQPIALVLARTEEEARRGALLVRVTYGPAPGGAAPVLSIDEAIKRNSFFENTPAASHMPELACGDVEAGMAGATVVVRGTVRTGGQKHFYMETQNALVVPDVDAGLTVHSSTQDATVTQARLSSVLGLPCHRIVVTMQRAGGAFGGKLTRGIPVAAAAAVAALKLGVPVRVVQERVEDTDVVGGREPLLGKYRLGADAEGRLVALEMDLYTDAGFSIDNSFGDTDMALLWGDNAYYVPNYRARAFVCRTNRPTSTSMRAPGVPQSVYVLECAMQHLAAELGRAAHDVRALNFYREGLTTPFGQKLGYVSLQRVWDTLRASAAFDDKLRAAREFNARNRWVKQGVSITPVKYGISWGGTQSGAQVSILAADGTVRVSHNGSEIGQGINVKVAQVAALALGVPMELVEITGLTTDKVPNGTATGGSSTSEVCARAVQAACEQLVAALEPVRKGMPGKPWREVVAAAAAQGVCLTATGWFAPAPPADLSHLFLYFVYGAACSHVQIDALTGETQVLSSDLLLDLGVSLNPAVDVGQVEGAFVQGIGYFLTEEVVTGRDGRLLTTGTWEYKPPGSLDIPIRFNVALLPDAPNPAGMLRSKASGEPPYALANSVILAVRDAVAAVRAEAGLSGYFNLDTPASPPAIQQACGTTADMLRLDGAVAGAVAGSMGWRC